MFLSGTYFISEQNRYNIIIIYIFADCIIEYKNSTLLFPSDLLNIEYALCY